jgi:hypothetical protein
MKSIATRHQPTKLVDQGRGRLIWEEWVKKMEARIKEAREILKTTLDLLKN